MSDSKKVLVMGATGTQGGSTARQLLEKGWLVRTLTRDPGKPRAQALAAQGVEVFQGDYDDQASLEKALEGVYGVFSVQTFMEQGPAGETRQGKALATAAQKAKVGHFVYSSVGGAERNSGIPHFESKWQVEQHISQLDMPTTILRPVFFMDNFLQYMRPQLQEGVWTVSMPLPATRKLQMIASEDIGAFAALAFENPQEFIGQELEIAGDELTPQEIVAAFSQAFKQPVQYVEQPLEIVRQFSEENAIMFEWFNSFGYAADLASLRKRYPQVLSFARWLDKHSQEFR